MATGSQNKLGEGPHEKVGLFFILAARIFPMDYFIREQPL